MTVGEIGMRKTAVYRDDIFLLHETGYNHPESPDRLRVIYEKLDGFKKQGASFIEPQFSPSSLDIIGVNHSRKMMKRIANTAGKSHDFLDADTQTSSESFAAALKAVGSLIDGVKRINSGEIDNAFCLVRPPGHHAEREGAKGFCLFNNVAIAAHYAVSKLGLQRVLIVDWDLHHGNGTQQSFYKTDKVMYISTHQYPYFPGTGAVMETGTGAGDGYNINVPLPGGQDDGDYARIFNELITPVARLYKPQLILVSAGFDIYKDDPLGLMKVSGAGFAYLTRVMVQFANELCDGSLLFTLEGGYNLKGMQEGCLAVLGELLGESPVDGYPNYLSKEQAGKLDLADSALPSLDQALELVKNYWDIECIPFNFKRDVR